MNLNQEQLERAVQRGMQLYCELKEDYPELRLYPVFSRFGPGSGQCELTTDPLVILVEFPEMLIVSPEAEHLGQRLRILKKAKKLRLSAVPQIQKDCEALRQQLPDPIPASYCGDVNIEFRTGMLMYESLRRLQQDPRLPSGRNNIGNIRVVAGTLEYLTQQTEKN